MQEDIPYDLVVVGGGLAGLSLSIQIANAGYRVIVFEKEKYPFHKVCGEYISYESWDFLEALGLDLPSLNVSHIKKLQVSDKNGRDFELPLPLGGFGISRFTLDHQLAITARRKNAELCEQTRVNEVSFAGNEFRVTTQDGFIRSKVVAGAFGKRSNIDIRWKRPFTLTKNNSLNNYIGIKYHIKGDFPGGLIALHNFKKGYCGLSKIEDDKYCLCYLTTAENLHRSHNDIQEMEQTILSENPHLKKIFSQAERLWKSPVTISQISFEKKNLVEDHVLMIGDAAGMITPLCGNGMSMALHASRIAAVNILEFLHNKVSRVEMERNYSAQWEKNFSKRMRVGRILQRLMLSDRLIGFAIGIGKKFPGIIRAMIKQTHGKPF